jgi:hypothetical protein
MCPTHGERDALKSWVTVVEGKDDLIPMCPALVIALRWVTEKEREREKKREGEC